MTWQRSGRWLTLFAATCALAACGGFGNEDGGGGGGGGGAKGAVTLSWLVDNSEQSVTPAKALADAFHAQNPNITVKLETRPQGGDLFAYNSGSLLQALSRSRA